MSKSASVGSAPFVDKESLYVDRENALAEEEVEEVSGAAELEEEEEGEESRGRFAAGAEDVTGTLKASPRVNWRFDMVAS